MNGTKRAWSKISRGMDLPAHVAEHLPLITLEGFGSISVDLQRGLLSYTDKEISVAVSLGTVSVRGDDLKIRLMKENRIVISGDIHEVILVRGTAQ